MIRSKKLWILRFIWVNVADVLRYLHFILKSCVDALQRIIHSLILNHNFLSISVCKYMVDHRIVFIIMINLIRGLILVDNFNFIVLWLVWICISLRDNWLVWLAIFFLVRYFFQNGLHVLLYLKGIQLFVLNRRVRWSYRCWG